jgi:hypothetical protein
LGKLKLDDSLDDLSSSGDDSVPFLGNAEGGRPASAGNKGAPKNLSSSSSLSSSVDTSDSDTDSDEEPAVAKRIVANRGSKPVSSQPVGGHRGDPQGKPNRDDRGKDKEKEAEQEREKDKKQKQKEKEKEKEEAEKSAAAGKKSLDLSVFVTNYEIDPKDIKLGELLGSGSYGKVYKAKLYAKDVAVKKLTTKFLDEKALRAFGHEVDIMWYVDPTRWLLFYVHISG